MKYCHLIFPVVFHMDGTLTHYIEVGPFPDNFAISSVPGPFLRSYEDRGCPREVVIYTVIFLFVLFRFQYNFSYPLVFDEPPNDVDFCIVPQVYRFILCVEFEVGINGVSSP